jgi:hypothetical protein
MNIVKSGAFWLGAVAGVVLWVVVLPKVAPGIKAKAGGLL